MKLTKRKLIKIIKEAIVDTVSQGFPEIIDIETQGLIPEVRNNILSAVETLKNWLRQTHPDLQVTEVFVVGAAITYQYGPESDIDVSVVIPGMGNRRGEIDDWMENNLVFPNFEAPGGVSRPYEFKPMENNNNYLHVDAALDPITNKFIKTTGKAKAQQMYDDRMNPESYEQKTYMALEKIIQGNFKQLYNVITTSRDGQEIKKACLNTYKRKSILKKLRGKSFSSAPDAGYVSQNWGSSNVLYKMLDREGYLEVFDILKPVYKGREEISDDFLSRLKIALEAVINDEIGYGGADYD